MRVSRDTTPHSVLLKVIRIKVGWGFPGRPHGERRADV